MNTKNLLKPVCSMKHIARTMLLTSGGVKDANAKRSAFAKE